MRNTMLLVIIVTSILSCSTQKKFTEEQSTALETAVSTHQFVITPQWAEPLDQTSVQILSGLQPAGGIVNGNRVQIEGGGHYINITSEEISVSLPYFGTRQISGGLQGNTGIVVDKGAYTWKESTGNKQDQRNIQIETSSNGEAYTIAMRLFARGKATVVINTSQRQSIRYVGTWK